MNVNKALIVLNIKKQSNYYDEAINIRTKAFFKGMSSSRELIQDNYEAVAIHLACLNGEEKIIGTGRLNIEEDIGLISQMAVDKDYQLNMGISKSILLEFISKCDLHKVKRVELRARESAIGFYQKYGFNVVGEKYTSQKTGIVHQKMRLILK
jgi:predicted GNAT family N-acyltransferase